MNSVAFLATAITLLPVLGLAVMALFAIMNEAATLHSFDGFEGMHFED